MTSAWPTIGDDDRCPCLSGSTFGECCAPFHRSSASVPTAERLMRSRYSAFVTGDAAYLLETWHPRTRPASLELDAGIRWFRLDILGRTAGGILDEAGTVEFRARFRMPADSETSGSRVGEQHELSRFERSGGRWVYVDGV